MTENKNEFLLKEFEIVSQIREDAIRQTNFIERNILVIIGLTWAWAILQNEIKGILFMVAWYLPLALSLLSILRILGLNQMIERSESYILKLESYLDLQNDQLGWNHHLKSKKNGKKTKIGWSAHVFWYAILIICVLVPILVYCYK